MFADICVSSALCASYEPLAEATSRPSTRAAMVPTSPIRSFTVFLDSEFR